MNRLVTCLEWISRLYRLSHAVEKVTMIFLKPSYFLLVASVVLWLALLLRDAWRNFSVCLTTLDNALAASIAPFMESTTDVRLRGFEPKLRRRIVKLVKARQKDSSDLNFERERG